MEHLKKLSFEKGICVIICFFAVWSMSAHIHAAGMSTSDNGIEFIKSAEGFRAYQYWDVSQYSIGYGSKTYDGEYPNGISEAQATILLKNQLRTYEGYVNSFLSRYGVSVNQNQYDALVSFTYNLGNVWVSSFNLRTYLIDGIEKYSEEQIRTAFGNWVYADHKRNEGLVNRRRREASLFLDGNVSEVSISGNHTIDTRYPKNIYSYPIASSGKITLYNSAGTAYDTNSRYIDYSDLCVINEIYTDGFCKVTYPSRISSTGKNTEYAKKDSFFVGNTIPISYSPASNINAYRRSDMADIFGTIWTTDKCFIVYETGCIKQLLYPLDSGGYKLGWINDSQGSGSANPLSAENNIPGPVAEGVFADKAIVVMAPGKISFGNNEYVAENDICIISNIDSGSGNCNVQYPSGGTDVFSAGQYTKNKTVSINNFVDYQPEFKLQKVTAQKSSAVYPTKAMESKGTNWSLDPGDIYYTVGIADNGATEVLYYCSRGKHEGYWKLGWTWLSYYSLNLNGYINGKDTGNIAGYGIADIYINGYRLLENGIDFCSANGTFPEGSSYEINNIRAAEGIVYNGVHSGNSTGILTDNTIVSLDYAADNNSCTRIEVESLPLRTVYKEGEKIDFTGLNILAYRADDSSYEVTDECEVTGYDSTSGIKTITVNYKGHITSFSVNVEEKKPVKITIASMPNKTSCYVGQKPDYSGMKIKAYFDNNTTEYVSDYDIQAAEDITLTTGKKDIIISYEYNGEIVITDLKINVIEKNQGNKPGDINGDGSVNNKDLTRLFQYLTGWNVKVREGLLDVNGDDNVNNKDITRLFQYLTGYDVEIYGDKNEVIVDTFVYGCSVNGRNLMCYSITPASYDRTILLEFEIHGFEDEYDHDGQVLVDTANELIEHYSKVTDLNNTRLLIIPSANPDGLLDGNTNNGFGRCNANGVDLNRDFDANYSPNLVKGRNYTPYAFSAPESRALRDLYYEYKPDIVIDFHGWLNMLIGDEELKNPFHEELGFDIATSFTDTNAKGYFSNWAHQQGSLAMLVEFVSSDTVDVGKVIKAVDRLIYDSELR